MAVNYTQLYQQSLDRQDRVEKDIAARNWSLANNQQQRQADAALQQQEISGRRQLANDQFSYNQALQGQEIQGQADANHARFQHDDELFDRHQAGQVAEMHLQQMQQEKMAKIQAQQEQQRLNQQQDFQDFQQDKQYDFQEQENAARQTHETNLHLLQLRGQEARDELLHRYDTDQLGEQHRWRAEELKQAEQAKQELAIDTHISTGVQKGLLYYPPEAAQDMANLESQRRKVQNSPYLNDEQKQQWDNEHYLPQKHQLFRSAVPKPAMSIDRNTAIDQQYGPDFRKQYPDAPIHIDPKSGMPEVDYKAWNVIDSINNRKSQLALKQQAPQKGKLSEEQQVKNKQWWFTQERSRQTERAKYQHQLESQPQSNGKPVDPEEARRKAMEAYPDMEPPAWISDGQQQGDPGPGPQYPPANTPWPPKESGAPQQSPQGPAQPQSPQPNAAQANAQSAKAAVVRAVQAARAGDKEAQKALERRGIAWQ